MLTLLLAAAALAAGPPSAWDGVNPFRCELQPAGVDHATGPHPDADPYCVDFDKTHQNVAQGGVVQFLSLEPARVAAATPKCFYFQSDHWRSSVVQDDGTTEVYEWDGHYFFDKATGDGGAWVTNFDVNGHTGDPSEIPGIPPAWAQDLGPGTGGAITHDDVPADPGCAARAQAHPDQIYARRVTTGATAHACPRVDGRATRRRLGPIALGERDGDVRAALGDPASVRRGFLRYCADGGGALLVGQPGDRSGDLGSDPRAPTTLVATTSALVRARGVHVGSRARNGVRRVHGVWIGARGHRVRWLAIGRVTRPALRRAALRPR